jgi:phytoene desaturase
MMQGQQLSPRHFCLTSCLRYLGKSAKIMSNFERLTRGTGFYFHTGEQFDYRPSIEDTNDEIRRFSPDDVAGYAKLLGASKAIFEVGFEKLADKPFSKFTSMLAQIPSLLKLQSYFSVAGIVNKYIKHPLLRQAFSIHPLLVGGNPFSTTSIYALIHYLERRWGVFFAMGGTGRLVAELDALLRRVGVNIVLNTDIASIDLKDGRAVGATTANGTHFAADRVICNGDPPTVYSQMLPAKNSGRKRMMPESMTQYSMGLFVLFFRDTQNLRRHCTSYNLDGATLQGIAGRYF